MLGERLGITGGGSVRAQEHHHQLIRGSGKDQSSDPQDYVSERITESSFELWEYPIAEDQPDNRSAGEVHPIRQLLPHLKPFPYAAATLPVKGLRED